MSLTIEQSGRVHTIREATVEDIPAIVEMAGHFLATTPYGQLLGFYPERMANLALKVLELGTILLASDGPRVIGMIAVVAVPHPFNGVPYADELVWWVEPAYRAGSLGPRLLHALEGWAVNRQLSLLRMVAPAGTEVGRFYERHGYSAIETSYVRKLG